MARTPKLKSKPVTQVTPDTLLARLRELNPDAARHVDDGPVLWFHRATEWLRSCGYELWDHESNPTYHYGFIEFADVATRTKRVSIHYKEGYPFVLLANDFLKRVENEMGLAREAALAALIASGASVDLARDEAALRTGAADLEFAEAERCHGPMYGD